MRHPTRVAPGRHDNSLGTRIDLAPTGSGIARHDAIADACLPRRTLRRPAAPATPDIVAHIRHALEDGIGNIGAGTGKWRASWNSLHRRQPSVQGERGMLLPVLSCETAYRSSPSHWNR
jgi:hypothetical protein